MAIMDDALGGSVENIAAHFLLRRMDALSSLLKGGGYISHFTWHRHFSFSSLSLFAVVYHILLGSVIFKKICFSLFCTDLCDSIYFLQMCSSQLFSNCLF